MPTTFSRVVLTAGVSGLASENQFREWLTENRLLEFPDGGPYPSEPSDPGAAIGQLDKSLAKGLPEVHDAKRVGAEYSGIWALHQAKRLGKHVGATLLHTQTFAGTVAAHLARHLLSRDFRMDVQLRAYPFDVSDRSHVRHSLGNFMQTVADSLREGQPTWACFMPIGGYKITTSLGYLVGAYLGFPTLYTHEERQILHEIPPVPIRIDPDSIRPLAPLMTSLLEPREITPDERALIGDHAWLFDVESEGSQELWTVSSFGRFLMAQDDFANLFRTKIFAAEQVHRQLEGGNRAFIQNQIRNLASKLTGGSEDPDLRHETTWKCQSIDGRHLFKGSSNDGVFRCLYRFHPQINRLEILYVWTDHGDYERQAMKEWRKPPPETAPLSLP